MAEDSTPSTSEDRAQAIVSEAVRLAIQEDTFQAIGRLERQGEPLEVAGHYHRAIRRLYGENKDVPRMLAIGRAGIHYCLSEAQRRASSDAELANKLQGAAKALSYDLSANSWPGWRDEGITITPSDQAIGLDLARVNLRLAIELKRDAFPLGNAHWLLGAQEMAAGRLEQARQCFAESARQFEKADKGDFRLMSDGYAALAERMAPGARGEGERRFDAVIAALKESGSDDATFFVSQLETAAEVFVR